ncbi:hypothetical protein H9X57_04095 [Flavobacterium piscinae]|nr:hypothetical protein [Flavobacterium piscinae]
MFLFLWICFISYAQDNKTKTDSAAIGYKKIENYSKKNKFTKFVHKLIFKSTDVKPTHPDKVESIAKKHVIYENKIIRKITIKTLDPFGYSEIDTTKNPNDLAKKLVMQST